MKGKFYIWFSQWVYIIFPRNKLVEFSFLSSKESSLYKRKLKIYCNLYNSHDNMMSDTLKALNDTSITNTIFCSSLLFLLITSLYFNSTSLINAPSLKDFNFHGLRHNSSKKPHKKQRKIPTVENQLTNNNIEIKICSQY